MTHSINISKESLGLFKTNVCIHVLEKDPISNVYIHFSGFLVNMMNKLMNH